MILDVVTSAPRSSTARPTIYGMNNPKAIEHRIKNTPAAIVHLYGFMKGTNLRRCSMTGEQASRLPLALQTQPEIYTNAACVHGERDARSPVTRVCRSRSPW